MLSPSLPLGSPIWTTGEPVVTELHSDEWTHAEGIVLYQGRVYVLCHGMTSLPLLRLPLVASDPIHLHSTSSASTLPLLSPLCLFCLHSTTTLIHTCTTCTTMSCPLSD